MGRPDQQRRVYIVGGAILSILGMVLLIPCWSRTGPHAGVLPLPTRFAVRDAARHRSRTAPAVAAVAATVAGVVALGIGGASDAAQARAEYEPGAPMGAGLISTFDIQGGSDSWGRLTAAVRKQLPGARIQAIRGAQESFTNTAAKATEYLLQGVYPGGESPLDGVRTVTGPPTSSGRTPSTVPPVEDGTDARGLRPRRPGDFSPLRSAQRSGRPSPRESQ
jgi:putative ABC transport system permease protein